MEDQVTILSLLDKISERIPPQAAPDVWKCAISQLPTTSGKILVAGAGRGGVSWALDQTGYDVTSIDLHPEHFSIDDLTCEYADLGENLVFDDDTFDVVLATEVIEHLENPFHFIREALRILNSDGVLIFTTPNVDNLISRWTFLVSGVFPYFRLQSFLGCYHVTPIHEWAVKRCCLTTSSKIESIVYSRVDFPMKDDIPRGSGGKGVRRRLLDMMPLNRLTGEIACYKICKTTDKPQIDIGKHYR